MSVAAPPYELLFKYWPLFEDAFWRFRQLCQLFPAARVTSWYRSPAHNAEVGGAPRSQHLLGLAIDAVLPEEQKLQFMDVARWLQLIPLDEGNHIHVQRYQAGLLPAVLFRGE